MILALVIILALLQLGDWWTTRTVLAQGGHEVNPIMARAFDFLGIDMTLALKVVAITAAGYYISADWPWAVGALITFYGYVVLHNYKQMK